jgi:conjugative transfer signal peptidase TraF
MSRRETRGGNMPLLAWGDALRAAKLRRKRIARRGTLVAIITAIVLAPIAVPPTPRLVWNVSASAPKGLWGVTPGAVPRAGDMVVARVPTVFRSLAAERRYLPVNVPLIKRVAAVAGDEVCAFNQTITVNDIAVAARQTADRMGRRMPFWLGCVRLHGSQLFLLMDAPASFDGRYFGVSEGADVIGKARLLWAR